MELLLLALLFMNRSKSASTSSSSSAALKAPRRTVTGKSKHTWYVAETSQIFGTDATKLPIFSVFASETGNDLVIAYASFPEGLIVFPDGHTIKDKGIRVLFYAAPSTLTKSAQADFID